MNHIYFTMEVNGFREADINDVDAIAEFESICFSGTEAWSKERWEDALTDPSQFWLLYFADNKIVGMWGCSWERDRCMIDGVAVLPDYRGHGIGKLGLNMLMNIKNKFSTYRLNVRSKNDAAISLYESMGFECIGVLFDHYGEPDDDACVYELSA